MDLCTPALFWISFPVSSTGKPLLAAIDFMVTTSCLKLEIDMLVDHDMECGKLENW